jgi:methyltransferase
VVAAYLLLLALLAGERLVELVLSRRHAAWALARGGIEVGRTHFVAMRLLHASFLLACALEVALFGRPFVPELGLSMLALVLLAQGLRYWAIHALGPYWNVRVIVVPGAPVVTCGPYHFVRHPNYLAVAIEGFAVPLVHTAWLTALLFSLANALLLAVRIRCEEAALEAHCDYGARHGGRARFLPGGAGLRRTARQVGGQRLRVRIGR